MKLKLSDAQTKQILDRATVYAAQLPKVTLELDNRSIVMHTPTRMCAWRILTYFTKEPETISWIDAMPEGSVLYDVGANIGLYSIWAAAQSVKVFAFEPEATNFAVLNNNLRENELTKTCVPFGIGISDVVGFGHMLVRPEDAGHSGHQIQVTDGDRFKPSGDTAYQGIATATLDHLVYGCKFQCPTHIKIDVDGLEHAVIKGAQRLLRDTRLKSIMIELMVKHQSHQPIFALLEEAGFSKDREMERLANEKTSGVAYTGNILFTRIE